MRHTYSYGWQVGTSAAAVSIVTFNAFMIAYGGVSIVTKDCTPHTDGPKVKEAVITALEGFLSADKREAYCL